MVEATVTTAAVAHHFEDLEQQHEAATLGMWAFLVTEVLFFGGLFGAYAVYRFQYPQAFAHASAHLDIGLGAANTAVLIGSSLTMALAVRAAQLGRRAGITGWILATMLLGSVFLGVKAVEYSHKFHEHLVPGPGFVFEGVPGGHEQLFFACYFAMTGMHAFHMLIGLALMVWLLALNARGRFTAEHHPAVELFGLYWHFVDIVWIFLFPLLYLLGRHA
jgi:cytochrome c oxidase subunit 3